MLRPTQRMILAGLVSLGATSAPTDATKGPKITYEAFVEATVNHHPERALDGKVLAKATEDQRRSGLLPDPQFTVGRNLVPLPQRYQHVAASDMDRAKAETTYGLSQSFPWPGTLAAEGQAAKARAATVAANMSLSALERRFAATELYLRLVRTAKLIDAERANLILVNGLREFAHEKFKQGVGSHMEFIQSHTEAGVLQANVASLELDLKNLKYHALLLMDHQTGHAPDAVDFVLEWPPNLITAKADKDVHWDLTRERIVRSKEADLSRLDAEYRRSLPLFNVSGMMMQEDGGMRMYAATIGIAPKTSLWTVRLRASWHGTSAVKRWHFFKPRDESPNSMPTSRPSPRRSSHPFGNTLRLRLHCLAKAKATLPPSSMVGVLYSICK